MMSVVEEDLMADEVEEIRQVELRKKCERT